MNFINLLIALTVTGMFASTGMILFKLSTKKFPKKITIKTIIKFIFYWKFLMGAVLYFIATICFFLVLRTEDLSIAYPITSITYILVELLSYFVLKEKLTTKKIITIILIVTGIVVMGL